MVRFYGGSVLSEEQENSAIHTLDLLSTPKDSLFPESGGLLSKSKPKIENLGFTPSSNEPIQSSAFSTLDLVVAH